MKLLIILSAIILQANFIVTAQKEDPTVTNQLVIVANNAGPTISKDIYGHFAEHLGRCIYGGIWVGTESKIPNTNGIRNDVLFALREMKIPNLRWPGGCFADTYHWKDGIGPQQKRASIVNIHWGGITEDNSFGTHEFMKLTELLGCDAYINGNLGSGSVEEMSDWVQYLTSDADSPMTRLRKENGREEPWKVKYFAIGNENWGCGGNMTDEYYANVMKQFSTYLNNYGKNILYRVACGPYSNNYAWTETLMKDPLTRYRFQGLSIHYYSGLSRKHSATDFIEKDWFDIMKANLFMDPLIKGHEAIMDRYDPQKTQGLIVDEWGNWFNEEPGTNPSFLFQQNTLRDAISAAIQLNIFNNHADRVKMANLAQTVNVLQSVILTQDEKMVLTPTYHVFKLFSIHQDARLLQTDLKCEDYTFEGAKIPSVTASASVDKENRIHISLVNLNPNKQITLTCPIIGGSYKVITGALLTAPTMNTFNSFDNTDKVKPSTFKDFTYKDGILTIKMPSKSIIVLELSK